MPWSNRNRRFNNPHREFIKAVSRSVNVGLRTLSPTYVLEIGGYSATYLTFGLDSIALIVVTTFQATAPDLRLSQCRWRWGALSVPTGTLRFLSPNASAIVCHATPQRCANWAAVRFLFSFARAPPARRHGISFK